MKRQNQLQPIDICAFNLRLKILRAGETIEIPSNIHQTPDVEAVRGFYTHFTYEILFVTEGCIDLVTAEGMKTYKRSVLIIPPRMQHLVNCRNPGCFSLLFSIEESRRYNHGQRLLEEQLKQGVCALELTEEACFYIRTLSEKSLKDSPTLEQECILLANLLFYDILKQLLPCQKPVGQREKGNAKHIFKIERYINANLSQKITLQKVADHMHLSTRQVARIVEQEAGCTLAELVTEKKLVYAERMIKKSNMSIEEIADRMAFGGSYFYTLFKKKYAMTPLQYRKKYKEKHQ